MPRTNFYKVDLYDVKYDHDKSRQSGVVEKVDTIIVMGSMVGAREILTNYRVDIVPERAMLSSDGLSTLLNLNWTNEKKGKRLGHHLVVTRESLQHKNIPSVEDVYDYVDQYETSPYKEIYESMKILTRAEQYALSTTVARVKGTKKYIKKEDK